MQKIIIKNFGPIKDAEIELGKITVLIGEQASGKSTIAKLIYFFKNLHNDLFDYLYNHDLYSDKFDFIAVKDSIKFLHIRFKTVFHNLLDNKFSVEFQFSDERMIEFSGENSFDTNILLSKKMINSDELKAINNLLNEIKKIDNTEDLLQPKILRNNSKEVNGRKLYALINTFFNVNFNNLIYFPASRVATTLFSEIFDKFFDNELNKTLKETNYPVNTFDSILMLSFIEHINYLKRYLKSSNSNYALNQFEQEKNEILKAIVYRNQAILKGKYSFDDLGEKIITDNGSSVFLTEASSGQQSSIRLIQDIFVNIITKTKVFRIIEEPEAHLFPMAQKHLIELYTLLANAQPENQIIITTHSPYVLSTFNNLLFASRVVEKNPDVADLVNEIMPKEFQMKAEDFRAYSITRNPEEEYCTNIVDEKNGMIRQNYLDTISEELGRDFEDLFSLHAKRFARQ